MVVCVSWFPRPIIPLIPPYLQTHDLVVGPEDPKGHLEQKYTNTIIGRYTNRIPVGTYSVSRNGLTAQVSPLPNSDATPTVSLHGGPNGFDQAEFEPIPLDALVGTASFSPGGVAVSSPPGTLFTAAELNTFQSTLPQGSSALFRTISKDGDQGYPGTLLVEVVVGLLPPQAPPTSAGEYHLGSIVFIYRAKLVDDGNKVITPINLTQVSCYGTCFPEKGRLTRRIVSIGVSTSMHP